MESSGYGDRGQTTLGQRRFASMFALRTLSWIALGCVGAWNGLSPAEADEPQPAAQAAAKPSAADAKSTDLKSADTKPAEPRPQVSTAEQLEFQQAKISAEMTELEQRMFHLAETLKGFEPENSARLLLGVKFAREELILRQMQEIQKQLRVASLAESVIEQKQLLAKLERLEQLLLSADLDFQMRLERLRQIREALRRLDNAIREEDRELKATTQTVEQIAGVAALTKRLAALDELVKRQSSHLAEARSLDEQTPAEPENSRAKLLAAQGETRASAAALIASPDDVSPVAESLKDALAQMATSAERLAGEQPQEAEKPIDAALEALRKAREQMSAEIVARPAQIAPERFTTMAQDQAGNRRATDGIAELVRGLGANGASSLGELTNATGAMSRAEDELGGQHGDGAAKDQTSALASLKLAREQLAAEAQRLQEQLRGEVKKRTLEGISLMLEQQIMVREATESLSKRAAQGSRQALASVVGLSKSEAKIVALADELITLVEETEFGIALPAALHVVADQMEVVKGSLSRSEAGPGVIADQKQIETDLEGMLDALKQMPATVSGEGRNGNESAPDQERELNRIIAELKLIRLLETRVSKDTSVTDEGRKQAPAITAAVRRKIEVLTGRQEDVRDITERLGAERNLDQQ